MKQLNMNEIQFSDEAIIRIIAGIANERIPHFNEIEVKQLTGEIDESYRQILLVESSEALKALKDKTREKLA